MKPCNQQDSAHSEWHKDRGKINLQENVDAVGTCFVGVATLCWWYCTSAGSGAPLPVGTTVPFSLENPGSDLLPQNIKKFRHHCALLLVWKRRFMFIVHHHHDLTVAEADFPPCSPSVGSWTVWWTPRRFLPSQRCLRPTGFPICLTQDLSKSWKLTERIDFAKTQAHWLFAVLLGLVSEMPPSLPSWLWSSMIHDRDHRRCIIIRFTCRTLRGAHPSHQTLRWCRAFSGLHRLRQRPTPDLAYCQIISNPN